LRQRGDSGVPDDDDAMQRRRSGVRGRRSGEMYTKGCLKELTPSPWAPQRPWAVSTTRTLW
jgi:hypothetical protein